MGLSVNELKSHDKWCPFNEHRCKGDKCMAWIYAHNIKRAHKNPDDNSGFCGRVIKIVIND